MNTLETLYSNLMWEAKQLENEINKKQEERDKKIKQATELQKIYNIMLKKEEEL